MTDPNERPGRQAYASFAQRYADIAPTKAHNALYERPATMVLLGDVDGLTVLDAGCGRHRQRTPRTPGATVHAFDVTPEMVALARTRCAGLAVDLVEGDLEAARLVARRGVRQDRLFARVRLRARPCADAARIPAGRTAGRHARVLMAHPMRDWMDERTRGEGTYFDTSRFGFHWSGFGEPKPYVEAWRRPLADILNAVADSGWRLDRFVEPKPLPEMKAASERLHAELSLAPAFLCIRARC